MANVDTEDPAPTPYHQLVEKLTLSCKSLEADRDPLLAELFALSAVISFLDSDPGTYACNLARPFIRLHATLFDILHGAKPPSIFQRERYAGATKPTNQWRDIMQGQIVGATNLLFRSGMKRADAAKWLESELAKQNTVHANGDRISASQILKWRERVSARKASKVACSMADDLRREHATIFNRGVEAAKQEARVLLRTIAKMIPQNPPSK